MSNSLNYSTMVDIYESIKNKDPLDNINYIETSIKNGYFDQSKTAKVLACCLAIKNKDILEYLSLMFQQEHISLISVLKAVYILDTQRYLNQLEKKRENLVKRGAKQTKIHKIEKLIKNNTNLDEGLGKTKGFKLNGAMCRRVINYFLGELSKNQLEKYAISMSNRQWQRLADILHVTEEDFRLGWFLEWIFDESKVPEHSIVSKIRNINSEEKAIEFIKNTELEYKVIRNLFREKKISFTQTMKNLVNIDPETYIWYYEDLTTPENDKKFMGKLNNLDLGCGKLIERITTIRSLGSLDLCNSLKPVAENYLNKLKIDIGKVSILGDSSASMGIAIKTSAIIGCVVSNICNADIRLFDKEDRKLNTPRNVNEVIELINTFRTRGATAPVVSLVPYYKNKEKVDTFIVVTDEEENITSEGDGFGPYKKVYKGDTFTDLFKKYLEEVNNKVNLVYVSFTQNGVDGQMVKELKTKIPGYERLMVFKVDKNKPDLTKIDKIINYISELK